MINFNKYLYHFYVYVDRLRATFSLIWKQQEEKAMKM